MADKKDIDWHEVLYRLRAVFAVVLALGVLVGGGYFVYAKAHEIYTDLTTPDDDYVGTGTEEVEVVVPSGAGITQIGDILYEADVVKSVRRFRSVVQQSGQADQLQYGRFLLKKELPAELAFEMLLDPSNLQRLWVTYPEGTTVDEQVAIAANELDISEDELQEAVSNVDQLNLPDWAEGEPEGLLFPARYVVAEPINPTAMLQAQVSQFNSIASNLRFASRAEAMGRTPREVLTVASIIEGEVHDPDYQPLVAAVIYNRLEEDMRLEMDSTVHYFAGNEGGGVTTTQEQRETENPYNTYLNEGLPPGPINNPGETAMAAALSPADSNAMYFVTVDLDSGETRFAETLEEHNENVAVFQEWCQANTGRC